MSKLYGTAFLLSVTFVPAHFFLRLFYHLQSACCSRKNWDARKGTSKIDTNMMLCRACEAPEERLFDRSRRMLLISAVGARALVVDEAQKSNAAGSEQREEQHHQQAKTNSVRASKNKSSGVGAWRACPCCSQRQRRCRSSLHPVPQQ